MFLSKCVEHLKRCKTSNLHVIRFSPDVQILVWFSTWISAMVSNVNFSRGAQKAHRAVPNEALYGVLRISRLITWTYLHPIFNSFDVTFPKWRPAKPRTGMSNVKPAFKPNLTLPVRFSQSDLLLTSSDGTAASSKDVERILLHCFSRLVIHFFLSGLTEVFLHVRCIPHQ